MAQDRTLHLTHRGHSTFRQEMCKQKKISYWCAVLFQEVQHMYQSAPLLCLEWFFFFLAWRSPTYSNYRIILICCIIVSSTSYITAPSPYILTLLARKYCLLCYLEPYTKDILPYQKLALAARNSAWQSTRVTSYSLFFSSFSHILLQLCARYIGASILE